jgi:hypothetical protein
MVKDHSDNAYGMLIWLDCMLKLLLKSTTVLALCIYRVEAASVIIFLLGTGKPLLFK